MNSYVVIINFYEHKVILGDQSKCHNVKKKKDPFVADLWSTGVANNIDGASVLFKCPSKP